MSKRRKSTSKKSRSIRTRSNAQKIADEKLFLKLLENEARKERKQAKQKTIKESRKGKRTDSKSTDKKGTKAKKPVGKTKVPIPSKTDTRRSNVKSTGKRVSNKRAESGRLRAEPQKRGSKQIDFTFERVRAIDKKINLFKSQSGDEIKKQLRKRGGKPPRGIIVTVTDKKGREKTEISPLDFVVNKDNTQEFITDMLERMRDDFLEWKEMEDEPGEDIEVNPYADYNPDTIAGITIKFII